MKCAFFVILASLIFFGLSPLEAHDPHFKKGVMIQDGPQALNLYAYPAPTVVDWNNDGAKDLVVGKGIDGNIWLFLNKGSDINPSFLGGTPIESNGIPIATSKIEGAKTTIAISVSPRNQSGLLRLLVVEGAARPPSPETETVLFAKTCYLRRLH